MKKFFALFGGVGKFVRESFEELQTKVTWPKYSELQNNATLVIVASILFALVIGLIDFVFDGAMNAFYESF
ncbi:MAG: preprotein translocase subunit SecE [Cytophagales bacterium]|nr:MAG: preprotein translocase subunit SecE [Cytophagales bacterium]